MKQKWFFPVATVVAALWVGWVIKNYFGWHPEYGAMLQSGPTWGNVMALVVVAGGGVALAWWRRIPRYAVLIWFILLTAVANFVPWLAFKESLANYSAYQPLFAVPGLQYLCGALVKATLEVVLLLIPVGLTLSLGTYLYRWVEPEASAYDLKHLLYGFALGAMCTTLLFFILGWLGVLYPAVVWGIGGGYAALSWRELWGWLRAAATPLTARTGWELTAAMFLLTILAANLAAILRPIPIGWDDSSVYINIPHLIAQYYHLLTGQAAYAWGLYSSLGFLLYGGHTETVLMLSWLGGGLVAGAMTMLVRRWWGAAYTYVGWLLGALFLSMPMVIFQLSKDLKIDLALTFFALVALAVADEAETKLTWRRGLWLGALLGFAFLIKYTAIFLIVPLGLWLIIDKRITKGAYWGGLAAVAVAALLTVGPWMVKNTLEHERPYWHSLQDNSLVHGQGQAPAWQLHTYATTASGGTLAAGSGSTNETPPPVSTGIDEELGRYIGNFKEYGGHKLAVVAMLPWDLTMGNYIRKVHTDVGYAWLALFPLLLLLIPYRRSWTGIKYAGLVLGYFILFALMGSGVPWYGLPGFAIMILLLGYLWQRPEREWKVALNVFMMATLGLFLFYKMNTDTEHLTNGNINDPVSVAYAGGVINEEQYLTLKLGSYNAVTKQINTDPEVVAGQQFVYRVGTFIQYFLNKNDRLILADNQLDTFNMIAYHHRDVAADIVQDFKDNRFKYLVVDLQTASIDQTTEQTLTKKFNRLLDFLSAAEEQGRLEFIGGDIRFYRARSGSFTAGRALAEDSDLPFLNYIIEQSGAWEQLEQFNVRTVLSQSQFATAEDRQIAARLQTSLASRQLIDGTGLLTPDGIKKLVAYSIYKQLPRAFMAVYKIN